MAECCIQKNKIFMRAVERNNMEIESAFSILKDKLLNTSEKNIEVNLGRLDLVSGKAIHELIVANEYAESLNKKIKFIAPQDVKDIIKFTGLDSFIHMV